MDSHDTGGSENTAVRLAEPKVRVSEGAKAQAIGPSCGGQTTKVHILTDLLGRPAVIRLTAGMSAMSMLPALFWPRPGR